MSWGWGSVGGNGVPRASAEHSAVGLVLPFSSPLSQHVSRGLLGLSGNLSEDESRKTADRDGSDVDDKVQIKWSAELVRSHSPAI